MIIHVVVPGDTLQLLARTYNASVQRIISDNGLMYPYQLTVGQALIITQPTVLHTVKAGESPFSIAVNYGISVQELYQNNPELTYGVTLYPGQVLTISFWGPKDRSIAINGYAYANIDQHVLRRALPFLSYLSIFSYGFRANGSLIPTDDAYLLNQARIFQALPIMVLTSIDEAGHFSSELVELLLQDIDIQNTLLAHIVDTLLVKGYRGLDVDFEYVPGELAGAYVDFLENVKAHLTPHGLLVHTDLAPKVSDTQPGLLYEGHDYRRIGEVVDRVMLMTYEWGYTYGPIGYSP
jgi:spore germination protein